MKLIDEKGRLFGKINLIDLLVVLLIVAVIVAVVWKLGGKKAAAAVTNSAKKAVYTVEIEDVPADIAAYAETLLPGTGGIGRYPAKGFVHLDVRAARSRWTG